MAFKSRCLLNRLSQLNTSLSMYALHFASEESAYNQITHGFPVDPDPLFKSNKFPIENRPGLHDQSLESVISQISNIVNSSDATVGDVTSWPPRIKEEVGSWLSDWHLVAFLCFQGLFSLVRRLDLTTLNKKHDNADS